MSLELASIDELVTELKKRCTNVAIGLEYFKDDPDFADLDPLERLETKTVLEGSFVTCRGLTEVLRQRCQSWQSRIINQEDEDDG